MTRIPHTRPPTWPGPAPAIAPDRFARSIRTDDPAGCRVALLGAPDDLGVRLNHGRPGATDGPAAFRRALAASGAAYDAGRGAALTIEVFDAGDVSPAEGDDAAALDETHARVTEAARALHDLGLVPVVIGGGHDLTFPTVRALAQTSATAVGGINVDPHLDVRETVGSGMPYRRLIDGGFLDPARFIELGVGRFSNSRAHVEWLRSQGATIILDEALTGEGSTPTDTIDRASAIALPAPNSIGFVSVDLDAIDSSQAPGVSAMNPSGLPVSLICAIARRAGAEDRVRHFDIMELSPPHDDPPGAGRTARVAALIFLHFVAGFADRDGP